MVSAPGTDTWSSKDLRASEECLKVLNMSQNDVSPSPPDPPSDIIVVECHSGSDADGEDPAALSSPGFALSSNDKPNYFGYDLSLSDPRSSIRKG